MQAATDLVESFVASGHNSSVFAAFVFFFMRADLPYDFRMVVWSTLAPAWRLLRLDPSVMSSSSLVRLHLEPQESNKRVLALMEEAVRHGQLTAAKNRVVFWLAVHHLSLWVFGTLEEEWLRLQMLKRLKQSCPDVFALIVAYHYDPAAPFPPETGTAATATSPDRAALLSKLDQL